MMGVFDDEIRAPFDRFADDGFVQRVVPARIGADVETLRDAAARRVPPVVSHVAPATMRERMRRPRERSA